MTRRELLQRLSLAYAGALLGCPMRNEKTDWFQQELVCIHIFNPAESLPAPLLEKAAAVPPRSRSQPYFNIGLPELVFCTTGTKFLDMFQYFWPFTREEFDRLQETIKIEFEKKAIAGPADIEELATKLRAAKEPLTGSSRTRAVILTYNEFTRHWTSGLIAACQGAGVEEFVVFKDPSRPPYLCDFPSKQKGFKKPPP